MNKFKNSFLVAVLTFSGAVLACTTLQMPIPRVNVSVWNLVVATFRGQTNPAQAAFLRNLDQAGEDAVGVVAWRANNYVGEVLVTSSVGGMTGGNLQFVDKPCDKKAIDLLPAPTNSNGGSSTNSFTNVNYNRSYYRPIYQRSTIVTTVNGVTTTTVDWVLVGYELVPGSNYNNQPF